MIGNKGLRLKMMCRIGILLILVFHRDQFLVPYFSCYTLMICLEWFVSRDCSIALYADDTIIYAGEKPIHDLQSVLQVNLNNIGSWMSSNRLGLNSKKSSVIVDWFPSKDQAEYY